MIKLKNIVIDGQIAKCEIFPEDSNSFGILEVNLETKEILNLLLPLGYEWCKSHIEHARDYLCSVYQEESIPNEKLIIWC